MNRGFSKPNRYEHTIVILRGKDFLDVLD